MKKTRTSTVIIIEGIHDAELATRAGSQGTSRVIIRAARPADLDARVRAAKGRAGALLVVSGGGSATLGLGYKTSSPAAPIRVSPPRTPRRLNGLVCWIRMETSLPDADQCDPENASQWTILLWHKRAQHLTPKLT